jgi:Na+-translocating ferredoxin:NAD+ oxidoreductase RnfD subunit
MTDTINPPVPPAAPLADEPSARVDPAIYSQRTRPLGHSGITIVRYYFTHMFGALFPLAAGLLMFGWRSGLVVATVMLAAIGALALWRRVGLRGGQLRYAHVLWLSLVLAMMLPAHLGGHVAIDRTSDWLILPLAGVLLVVFCWLLGGLGAGRIHPVVVTYLVLVVLYNPELAPRSVLQRNCLLLGNLLNASPPTQAPTGQDGWRTRPILPDHNAISSIPAAEYLSSYTTGQVSPERNWLSLEGLLRDRLPPLEDLILGAYPGPIGTTSAIAIIVGGLFLLYRGLIDYRIPLLVVLAALIALLILPIPVVITNHAEWRWAPSHVRGIGWAMGTTFANYEILGSPLIFTAFFLATAPSVRPMTRRGRTIFSILIGVLAAVFQLYVSVSFGSYLALMGASLVTPALDKYLLPRALV